MFEKYNDSFLDVLFYIFFLDIIYDLIESFIDFISDSYEED